MPVVDIATLDISCTAPGSSLLVIQAVMLAGAIMSPNVCSKATVNEMYRKVKALVHSDYEPDPLNKLIALCLMQWYTATAPKDISMDTPRFWNVHAVGLAQQMGLHRSPKGDAEKAGLRRRVWFTLYARDSLTSAAHGRPRLLDPADSDVDRPRISDFPHTEGNRAETFLAYIAATSVLGDLCQTLNRKGKLDSADTERMLSRLECMCADLPPRLRLVDDAGNLRQYDLDVAQLHVHVLACIVILYRPRSVFSMSPSNAASVTVAMLLHRIFEAVELREHTRLLSSAFAWYLLAASIPLLSRCKVPALRAESEAALDALQCSLTALSKVRPAAANNLKSVRAIRKAIESATHLNTKNTSGTEIVEQSNCQALLSHYGPGAMQHYSRVVGILQAHNHSTADASGSLDSQSAAWAQPHLGPQQDRLRFTPEQNDSTGLREIATSLHTAHTAVLQDETLFDSWMVRDWMDDFLTSPNDVLQLS